MFGAMSGDYNALHTNDEFMKKSDFGRRIVHGLLGLAISRGLLFRTGYREGTAITFLGIESWKFEASIFFGDTIHVKLKVAGARASISNPNRGVVKLFLQIINPDGGVGQSGFKNPHAPENPFLRTSE